MVPGPASRIDVATRPTRLLPGQHVRLDASVCSRGGDRRDDRIEWRSSLPQVARVGTGGILTAIAPGRAILTASAGGATRELPIEVVAADVRRRGRHALDDAGAHRRRRTLHAPPSRTRREGDRRPHADLALLAGPRPDRCATARSSPTSRARIRSPRSYGSAQRRRRRDGRAARRAARPLTVVGTLPRTAFPTSEVWIHPNGKVAYLGTVTGRRSRVHDRHLQSGQPRRSSTRSS